MHPQAKDPVRNINNEFLAGLVLESNKIFPLPGAVFPRVGDTDPRLPNLVAMSGLHPPSEVAFYEHLATVRHQPTGRFFVAFRQTMDALFREQKDTAAYPEWLMKSGVKNTELKTYIYAVRELYGKPLIPSRMNLKSHEDWLVHVTVEWVFDTLAYFMLKNNVISEEMFRTIA
jgi:hypothetical protein